MKKDLTKKGFDSEPMHDEKYLRTKIKSYDDKIKCLNKVHIGYFVIDINRFCFYNK